MTDKLYDLMNWADVEEIVYSESKEPGRILGAHLGAEGLLVQAFIPTAKKVAVKLDKQVYEMELADDEGFFAALIPAKKAWEEKLPKYTLHITYDNDTEEETADPYAFASSYTEEDLKKFEAGIHYTIYEKMGAHPMVKDGVSGVNFSVWAPEAMRVSVVGDFNLWDGRRHMMNRLGDSGVFELFIPQLAEGALYKYEIKNRHGEPMVKIDPYANGFELRPANASIVRSLDGFAWTDGDWMEKRRKADHKKLPMAIYEVHLGSFMRKPLLIEEDGTPVDGSEFYNYREIAPKLAAYVKEQGFTHVELMPVMEHPFDGSWGYQVTGYYAPTSRFGTPEDFMYFMDYMHKEGVAVILDWVPAHFPRDSWGMAAYDGTALYEHQDPRQGAHPHWGTLIYNYGRPQVSNFLIANAMFWADKYHADGIRMDAVASMLYLDYGKQDGEWVANMYGGNENLEAVEFLKHLNSMFKKRFAGAVLIAEESTAWPLITAPVDADGLGFDYKWNMGWMNDFLRYMKCDPYFRKNNYGELTFSMMYNYSEDFVLVFSHDEVVHGKGSMLGKMPGETFEEKARNLRTAYGFFAGHPGKKLLFMGQEFAQNDEWSEERELEWGLLDYPVHAQMQNFVRDLNTLYTTHPAMYMLDYNPEGFEWINCSYSELSLVMFVRKTKNPEETLLFVCNFDNMEHKHFRVGVPFMCEAKALLCSDDKKYGGEGLVSRHARKAKKLEWDDRTYSVEVDIPAMSTTIYQLTPTEDPEEKAAQKAKKAVKKTATKKTAAKKTEKQAIVKQEKKTTAVVKHKKKETAVAVAATEEKPKRKVGRPKKNA